MDEELEKIKKQKLEKYYKYFELKKKEEEKAKEQKVDMTKINNVVYSFLTERAPEVMKAAEKQYPSETNYIKLGLYKMIASGQLNEKIDGGTLLALFRSLGLDIYIETSVKFVEHGKVKSLADKLSEEQ
ncbi:MAG: DNA-binding protein [Thermoproteota archaeon]|nr:double-stranded DNA-binding protein [Candidatus Brockarchaeota archaeon]MBO3762647.1 double-stranded DNA-binding protein [Candidatus Brockarchaeota archaeon]MBO3768506.1 double-stranded DNA-binding protein [Candidatus Brockarchaeota archaeon]MBO3801409.1 double-stranded DNA-binding protein [Candidatus Brockarchaeota archaeon]